ncbi:MAG: DUF4332 domain-containing protein [Bacteroidota bacterium]
MGYYIDLSEITLEAYRAKLLNVSLSPGRRVLKDRTEERFDRFREAGITNVQELMNLLKNKKRFAELTEEECFSDGYLTILLRELKSMLPKPVRLSDLYGISQETVEILGRMGLSTTEKLYPLVLTGEQRRRLAGSTGIGAGEVLDLAMLTDLSRIKWAGPLFVRMLADLGRGCVRKVAESDPEELHEAINELNREREYFRGKIGLNDIRIFVEAAGELPVEMDL